MSELLLKYKWTTLVLGIGISFAAYAEVTLRDGTTLNESPVRIVSYVEVSADNATDAEVLIRAYVKDSHAVQGNLEAEALRRIHHNNHFVILESWATPAAYDKHLTATKTRLFRSKLQPTLIAPMDVRRHAVLTTASEQPSVEDQSMVYVVTHVDVVPPQQFSPCTVAPDPAGPCANDLIKAFAASSRDHDGNRLFEVLTQSNRGNHMTVIEAWQNVAAHAAHHEHKDTVIFRSALAGTNPNIKFDTGSFLPKDLMIGSLWDERLYVKLKP